MTGAPDSAAPSPPPLPNLNVAVIGCGHGELDQIYAAIVNLAHTQGVVVDLCLIAGDVQAARNQDDLLAMAVPPRYRRMGSFYKYYSGEAQAPVPTIFIGGNHEASALSMELWPGGWVAPNIYYLGSASVVDFAGLRIAGLSGIYKPYDYEAGYYERFPLGQHDQHSVFHVRRYDIQRLSKLSSPIDMFLSHDWPVSITDHGDLQQLLRAKPFFRDDIAAQRLGNPHLMDLMRSLQPEFWFAGHMHVKFAAVVDHPDPQHHRQTKFLALDKCLPGRRFLQVVAVPARRPAPFVLAHDPEWLAIVKATAPYLSLERKAAPIPDTIQLSDQERQEFVAQDLTIRPEEFASTVPPYDPNQIGVPPIPQDNAQVRSFYARLGIPDPMLSKKSAIVTATTATTNPDEIDIDF